MTAKTPAGRYVFQVETRAGRGRNFVRILHARFEDKASAEADIAQREAARPAQNGVRYVINKTWTTQP